MTASESEVREGYRMTELGELPEKWEAKPLREVISDSFSGGTPSTKEPSYWGGHIPWITTRSLSEGATAIAGPERHITDEGLHASSSQIAPPDAVIVGTRVGVGKTAVAPYSIAVNQDLTILLPKANVSPAYLAWAIRANPVQQVMQERKRGVTIKGITREDLLSILMPLPPFAEQRKIAAVLQTVQQAKERTEAVIQAARELKKSLLKYLFTYGPVPVDQAEDVELKETEIGEIPEDWRTVRLEEINKARRSTLDPSDFPDEEFDYYSIPAYQEFRRAVRERGENIGSVKLIIEDGTVLFGKLNPRVEKVWLVSDDTHRRMIGSTEWLPLLTDESEVERKFLYYLAWSPYIMPLAKALVTGSTPSRQRVDPSSFYSIRVPLPPKSQQTEIGMVLGAVDDKIAAEEDHKRALEELFNTLLNDLMTAKIRVNDLELGEVDYDEAGR